MPSRSTSAERLLPSTEHAPTQAILDHQQKMMDAGQLYVQDPAFDAEFERLMELDLRMRKPHLTYHEDWRGR